MPNFFRGTNSSSQRTVPPLEKLLREAKGDTGTPLSAENPTADASRSIRKVFRAENRCDQSKPVVALEMTASLCNASGRNTGSKMPSPKFTNVKGEFV